MVDLRAVYKLWGLYRLRSYGGSYLYRPCTAQVRSWYSSLISSTCPTVDTECESNNRILRNFRELLWFWREYYARRGRDRLSLEFSSCRITFREWDSLVDALCADDGSPCSLLSYPSPLPDSPYLVSGKQMMRNDFRWNKSHWSSWSWKISSWRYRIIDDDILHWLPALHSL